MKEDTEKFLKFLEVRRGFSPTTLRGYACVLRNFSEFVGSLPLEKITYNTIDEFILKNSKGKSRATINYYIFVLRSFFRQMNKSGLKILVSADHIETTKVPEKPIELLTDDDLDKLINFKDNKFVMERAIVGILYTTGMRLSEMMTIPANILELGPYFTCVGKGGKMRDVNLQFAWQAIEEYKSHESNHKAKDGDKLFNVSNMTIQRLLKHYGAYIGLQKRLHPHMLRHHFATRLMEKGVVMGRIQDMLGHTSPTTTQRYINLQKQLGAEEAKKIEEAISIFRSN